MATEVLGKKTHTTVPSAKSREWLKSILALPQWGESFSKHLWFANVNVFWLKWAGYLAVAGLNLLAQISDRISPFGV